MHAAQQAAALACAMPAARSATAPTPPSTTSLNSLPRHRLIVSSTSPAVQQPHRFPQVERRNHVWGAAVAADRGPGGKRALRRVHPPADRWPACVGGGVQGRTGLATGSSMAQLVAAGCVRSSARRQRLAAPPPSVLLARPAPGRRPHLSCPAPIPSQATLARCRCCRRSCGWPSACGSTTPTSCMVSVLVGAGKPDVGHDVLVTAC